MKEIMCAALVIVAAYLPHPVFCQITVAANTSSSNGQNTYNYAVKNLGTAAIWEVSIDSAPTTFATAPTGWAVQTFYSDTRLVTQWLALNASAAIQPGATLAG